MHPDKSMLLNWRLLKADRYSFKEKRHKNVKVDTWRQRIILSFIQKIAQVFIFSTEKIFMSKKYRQAKN